MNDMAEYADLLIVQYAGKPNATATIRLLSDQWIQSFEGAASIPEMLNIDIAAGVNLDIVGKIVGQDRTLPAAVPREFFAFEGNLTTKGYQANGQGGSPWYRKGDALESSGELSDSEMRILIKARTIKNFSRCSMDDVERACEVLFGKNGYQLTVTAPCVWTITTQRADPFVLYAARELDVLPRAAGVRYEFTEE
jgi:hypothetical protein